VYYVALCEGLELIGANPGLGHSHPDLPEPYKAYIVRKHVMVYKVKQGVVYVACILHGRMDFPKQDIDEG
jgi:plasmid stabilization system protein ParE